MTQPEFEQRTGLKPTAEEFANIHKMYMACATIDKDDFCKEFKKFGASKLVNQLWDAATARGEAYNSVFDEYMAYKDKICRENLEMAKFLLGKAATYNDTDFENEALRLVSKGTAILIKAKYGYPMSNEDLDYIAKNLK